ncbi:MAG: translocation/assembly module TamB domain-containing protein [Deltaproteobacteria bacterium]|nr:translocation/assembly module TamB domain-containing protein [Deltaproteobacteria bacterium]
MSRAIDPERRGSLRRWLRRVCRWAAVALICSLLALSLIDRARLMGRLLSTLGSGQLHGQLQVERVELEDGALRLVRGQLLDPDGVVAVSFARIEVRSIWRLLFERRVDRLIVSAPQIWIRTDSNGSNFDRIFASEVDVPRAESSTESLSLPRIAVDGLVVDHGDVHLIDSSTTGLRLSAAQLSLHGSVELGPSSTAEVTQLSFVLDPGRSASQIIEGPIQLKVLARVSIEDDVLSGRVEASSPERVKVAVDEFRVGLDLSEATARGTVTVEPLGLELVGLDAPAPLAIDISAGVESGTIQLVATATVGSPRSTVSVRMTKAEVLNADVWASELDLAAIDRRLPESSLSFRSSVHVEDDSIGGHFEGRGRVGPIGPGQPSVVLSELACRARWESQQLEFDVRALGAPESSVRASSSKHRGRDLSLLVSGLVRPEDEYVERGEIDVKIPDLSPFSSAAQKLGGRVSVKAAVRGTLDRSEVELLAEGSDLRSNESFLEQVRVESSSVLRGMDFLGSPPSGELVATATGLRSGDLRLDAAKLAAAVKPRATGAIVELWSLDLETGESFVHGRATGEFSRDRIAIRRLHLETSGGPLTLTATVTAPSGSGSLDSRDTRGEAHLSAKDFDLSKLEDWVPGLEGRLSFDADVFRKKSWGGELLARYCGVRAPPYLDGLDGELSVDIGRQEKCGDFAPDPRRDVCLEISAREPKLTVSATATWPLHSRLPNPSELDADVELGHLDLAAVAELAKVELPVEGVVSARGTGRSGRWRLGARLDSGRVSYLDPDSVVAAATVTVDLSDLDEPIAVGLTAAATSAIGSLGVAAKGRSRWPLPSTPELGSIESVTLKLDPLNIPPSLQPTFLTERCSALERETRARCHGRLTLALGQALRTGELTGEWVMGKDRVGLRVVMSELGTHAEALLTSAEYEASSGPLVSLILEGERLDVSSLSAGDDFRKNKIRGQIETQPIRLDDFLGEFLETRGRAELGRVVVSGALGGSIGAPNGRIEVAWSGAKLDEQPISGKVVAEVESVGPSSLEGELGLRVEAGKGFVQLDAQAKPGPTKRGQSAFDELVLSAEVVAAAFPLEPLSSVLALDAGFSGSLSGKAKMSHPGAEVEADLVVEDLGLSLPVSELPPLEGGRLGLRVRGSTGAVELRARAGEGSVSLVAEGTPKRVTGHASVEKLLVATSGLQAFVDASSTLELSDSRFSIVLDDTFVRVPGDSGANLHPIRSLPDVVFDEEVKETAALSSFEASVRTRRPIQIRGEEIETELEIDLTKTEGADGYVRAVQGTITLFGREYRIDRARLSFAGALDPGVEVRLVHEGDGFTLIVEVGGTAQRPEVRFSSEPSTYDSTALLRIFLGTDPEELDSTESTPPTEQASGMLASYLAGEVTRRLASLLYLDTIELESEGTTPSGVRVGKWLTRRVFLSYHHRLTTQPDQNTGEAALRYGFLPGWQAEALFGDRANGHVELSWVKRF